MMQDNSQDFDLQVRSMLEEAEIRPARGTWKAISRRLDAAVVSGSPAARPGLMRWAGAAMAFAAVALGVFIALPDSSERPHEIVRGALTAESAKIITPIMEDAAPIGLTERMYAKSPADNTPSVSVQEGTDQANAAQQPAVSQDLQNTQIGDKSKDAASGSSSYDNAGESAADPFAILAQQEEQDRRRGSGATFLYAKGAIGGNDPDFVSRSAGISMAPGTSSSGITELSESTYGIPLTLGLGIRFYMLPRLSIGTGLDYSLLTRTFTGTYTSPGESGETQVTEAGNVQHTMQYIGIPLDLYYDILTSGRIKFYVYGGGEAEYCISNKYTVFSSPKITCSEPVRKFQYSVGGGVGVEFRLADNLGLYLDPGVKYYFPGGQPKSIRTDKPFMFNFDAGLRFSL